MVPSPEDVQALAETVYQFVDRSGRQQAASFDPHKVAILAACLSRSGTTSRELVERLNLSAPSITRLTRALEDAGSLRAELNPDDGRSFLLYTTEQGLAELQAIMRAGHALWSQVVDDWSREDLLLLTQLLKRLMEDWIVKGPAVKQREVGRKNSRWQTLAANASKEETHA